VIYLDLEYQAGYQNMNLTYS